MQSDGGATRPRRAAQMIHVAEARSLRRSPPRRCTSTHLARASLQTWAYQAHAGPSTSTGTQTLALIMLPAGTVKAGRGQGAGVLLGAQPRGPTGVYFAC